jgi:hypothetical protein
MEPLDHRLDARGRLTRRDSGSQRHIADGLRLDDRALGAHLDTALLDHFAKLLRPPRHDRMPPGGERAPHPAEGTEVAVHARAEEPDPRHR